MKTMETMETTLITVSATINAVVDTVWELWTSPKHITKWNYASNDWHTPRAENDLRVGGRFLSRMEAKDGSMGFDFTGTYKVVKTNELIEYVIDDGRKVRTEFINKGKRTKIVVTFEAESVNSPEQQQSGWQSIMDNFKSYAETAKSYGITEPIYPCLWFNGQAREAADFYCSIFKNSRILSDTPMVLTFELDGKKFMGLNGGPLFKFNEAVSFVVSCATQEEIDYFWSRLTEGGRKASVAGSRTNSGFPGRSSLQYSLN